MVDTYVKQGGLWYPANKIYAKTGGVWQVVRKAYVNQGGVWTSIFKNLPEVIGLTSANIADVCEELVTEFPDVVLSAGPLFGSSRSNTAGAYEVIVAPGIRLAGDTGTSWNQTKRYVLQVTGSGFTYSTATKYRLNNLRGGLRTATANNNLVFEQDTSSFTTGTVLEFNHPVRWANLNASSPTTTISYILPRPASAYTVVGGGGGGGSCNNNGDAGAGAGGDSGGFRVGISVSALAGTTTRIIVGQGGVGASYWFNGPRSNHPNAAAKDNANNNLWNNFFSYGRGEKGTDSSVQFDSSSAVVSTGGGGGIAAFNNNAVGSPSISGQNTGPGSPNGRAGSKPPFDSDASQAGGNTGIADNVGDGGTGVLGTAVSGYDGAVWITLA